ncbi:glycosyltransferase family 2 protein [Clostridioides difficile]
MKKLISAVIVNWNGEKYLYKCINSLLKQDYENVEIIVIDNDSTDNSVEIINKSFKGKLKLIQNKNIGYAGGANTGIENSNGDYVMIANPDVIFEKDYLSKCIKKLDENSENAAVIGKLLKYDFDKDEIINFIDSAGIGFNHKRQGRDIGQNDADIGQYEEDRRVFGVCGAAAVFKRNCLEKIKIDNDYFDSDFFAYKEDIDICWRLNLYGFKCYYIHDAIAYHGRGMNSSKGIINTIKNRKNQSEFLKGISFRNHYLMLMKNENNYCYNKDRVGIYIDYMKYIVFFLLFDFKCLKYVNEVKNLKSKMMKKRDIIMKNTKLSDEEIYKLFDL